MLLINIVCTLIVLSTYCSAQIITISAYSDNKCIVPTNSPIISSSEHCIYSPVLQSYMKTVIEGYSCIVELNCNNDCSNCVTSTVYPKCNEACLPISSNDVNAFIMITWINNSYTTLTAVIIWALIVIILVMFYSRREYHNKFDHSVDIKTSFCSLSNSANPIIVDERLTIINKSENDIFIPKTLEQWFNRINRTKTIIIDEESKNQYIDKMKKEGYESPEVIADIFKQAKPKDEILWIISEIIGLCEVKKKSHATSMRYALLELAKEA